MSRILTYTDIELPRATTQRLICAAPAASTMCHKKDAKLAISKAATLFVSYLTAGALDVASSMRVKMVSHEHVLQALVVAGWTQWVDQLGNRITEYQRQTGRGVDHVGGKKAAATAAGGSNEQDGSAADGDSSEGELIAAMRNNIPDDSEEERVTEESLSLGSDFGD